MVKANQWLRQNLFCPRSLSLAPWMNLLLRTSLRPTRVVSLLKKHRAPSDICTHSKHASNAECTKQIEYELSCQTLALETNDIILSNLNLAASFVGVNGS